MSDGLEDFENLVGPSSAQLSHLPLILPLIFIFIKFSSKQCIYHPIWCCFSLPIPDHSIMPSINDSDKFETPSNEPVLSSQLMKKFWISPLPSSLDHSIHHVRAHQSDGDPSRFDTFGSVSIFDFTKADNGEPSWRSAPDGFEGWCVDLLFHARHLFEATPTPT